MNPQQNLFDQAHARRTDPETSHEAAASVSKKIRESQATVLHVLETYGPMTDGELVVAISSYSPEPMSVSGARTRRSELVKLGKVRFTGEFGRTRAGRRTRIWDTT